jgi:mannose-6-phosphate isomerase-like protein (cupin superfamily)
MSTPPEIRVHQPGKDRSYWVLGDLYTCLASGEQTGGAYALIEGVVPPGGGPPPHIHHREDEAFYIVEGRLTFESDDKQIDAAPGTWVWLPRGSRHTFRNVGQTPARILIVVNPTGLEKFFAEVGQEVTDPGSEPGPAPPGDVAKLLARAPDYGLEIFAPGG